MRGWKLLAEKLPMPGVGLKEVEQKRNIERKEATVPKKRKAPSVSNSFADVVADTEFRTSNDVIRVRVSKDEVEERLGHLASCLVGWWGGGTSPMLDLKTLRRWAWSSWKVKGYLNVEEMGKGLCLGLRAQKKRKGFSERALEDLRVSCYLSENGEKKLDATLAVMQVRLCGSGCLGCRCISGAGQF